MLIIFEALTLFQLLFPKFSKTSFLEKLTAKNRCNSFETKNLRSKNLGWSRFFPIRSKGPYCAEYQNNTKRTSSSI